MGELEPAGTADIEPGKVGAEPAIDDTRHSLARNTFVLFLSQIATWSMALVGATMVPRFIGDVGVGQLRLASSIWTIAVVFVGFGLGNVVVVEVARNRRQVGILGQAIGAQIVLFVPAAIGVAAFVVIAGFDSTTRTLVILGGIGALGSCVALPVRSGFQGLEQMSQPALVDIVAKLAALLLKVGVLVTGFGVLAVATSDLTASAFALVFVVPIAIKMFGRSSLRPRFDGLRELLGKGWPFFVIEITLVLYFQVDTLVIALLASREELGWYAQADVLFGTLLFAPTILMTSMFPTFARLEAEGPEALERQVRRAYEGLMLLAIPVGLGTVAVGTPICELLFGADFKESGPVLSVYGLVVLFAFPTILLGRVALATGRQKLWARLMLVATVVSVPVDLVLVPWTRRTFDNGAIGGPLTYLVTEALIMVLAIKPIAPHLFARPTVIRLGKALAAGSAMLAAAWALRDQFVLIPVAAGAVIYPTLVVVLRAVEAENLAVFRRLLRRLAGPLARRS